MPRVHTVKKSRKEFPGIPKGSKYFWWKLRNSPNNKRAGGRIIRSLTYPRPSQLTQSEFYSAIYSLGEEMEDWENMDFDLQEFTERVQEVADEQEEKMSNMESSGLENTPTYEMLEERKSAVEEWVSELEGFEAKDEDDIKGEVLEAYNETQEEGGSQAKTFDDIPEDVRTEKYDEAVAEYLDELKEITFQG